MWKGRKSMLENGTSRGVTFEAQDKLLFQILTKEELRTKQLEDPHVKPLIECNISGGPEWQEVSCMSPVTKSYWAQWGSIEMVDGILYRRWEDASGRDVKYLYLAPKVIQDDVLQNLHDSPTAGHFGVKKMFAYVRQHFYWTNLLLFDSFSVYLICNIHCILHPYSHP